MRLRGLFWAREGSRWLLSAQVGAAGGAFVLLLPVSGGPHSTSRVAALNHHPPGAINILNVRLDWTFLGWPAALV